LPCLVCGEPDTIKAHVLPRALIHEIRGGAKHALGGWRDRNGADYMQSGLWDRDILCITHEGLLQEVDTYAVEFCRAFDEKAEPVVGAPGFTVNNPRPDLLTRFAMSVVWRFAVSRRGRALGARLGPYEGRLRALVFDRHSSDAEPDIVVMRREHQLDGRTIPFALQPHWAKVNGVTYWQFHIATLDFRLKLDARLDGVPAALLAKDADPLIVTDLGPVDVQNDPTYAKIFARMSAGSGPPPWLDLSKASPR